MLSPSVPAIVHAGRVPVPVGVAVIDCLLALAVAVAVALVVALWLRGAELVAVREGVADRLLDLVEAGEPPLLPMSILTASAEPDVRATR